MRKEEKQFADYLDSQGKFWIHKPKKLDTGKPCEKHNRNIQYTPNFYCFNDDCYYEVVFTKQSHEINMKKIKDVLLTNPDIKIKSVHPNGVEYGTYPYDKEMYINTDDLKEMFVYNYLLIQKTLRVHDVEYKLLGNGKKIYNKKEAINLLNKVFNGPPFYSIKWKNIKKIRVKHKVTTEKLANLLGIHCTLLSKYENGHIRRTRSKQIFDAFNDLENVILKNIDKLKYIGRNGRSIESYYWRERG